MLQCGGSSAGSAVDAARQLRIDRANRPWNLQPSVGTWYRPSVPSPRQLRIDRANRPWNLQPSVGTWYRPSVPASILYKVERFGIEIHQRIPPWLWCVDEQGFDIFLDFVRIAHSQGQIPNDPDPGTGRINQFHDDPEVGPNMHTVNKYVIIPKTRSMGGTSWALMQQHDGLPISFFVTHSWKEGVYEFYRKVKHSWPAGMCMWCCFLANPQSWDYKDLKGLLGVRDDLSDSPFMQALSASTLRLFLVVPNCVESLYRRLWCVAELKKAMEIELSTGTPFIQVAKDPLISSQKLHANRKPDQIGVMLSEATCSDQTDELRIRAYIGGHEHEIENMIKQIAKTRSSAPKHQALHVSQNSPPLRMSSPPSASSTPSACLGRRQSLSTSSPRAEAMRMRTPTSSASRAFSAKAERESVLARPARLSAGFQWARKKMHALTSLRRKENLGNETVPETPCIHALSRRHSLTMSGAVDGSHGGSIKQKKGRAQDNLSLESVEPSDKDSFDIPSPPSASDDELSLDSPCQFDSNIVDDDRASLHWKFDSSIVDDDFDLLNI